MRPWNWGKRKPKSNPGTDHERQSRAPRHRLASKALSVIKESLSQALSASWSSPSSEKQKSPDWWAPDRAGVLRRRYLRALKGMNECMQAYIHDAQFLSPLFWVSALSGYPAPSSRAFRALQNHFATPCQTKMTVGFGLLYRCVVFSGLSGMHPP